MSTSQYMHSTPSLLLETVGDDREIFLELAEIFMRESTEKLEKMQEAAKAGDLVALAHHSHALKGTVGPLGADVLMQELIDIEAECNAKTCNFDEHKQLFLITELNHVCRELQEFIVNFS